MSENVRVYPNIREQMRLSLTAQPGYLTITVRLCLTASASGVERTYTLPPLAKPGHHNVNLQYRDDKVRIPEVTVRSLPKPS